LFTYSLIILKIFELNMLGHKKSNSGKVNNICLFTVVFGEIDFLLFLIEILRCPLIDILIPTSDQARLLKILVGTRVLSLTHTHWTLYPTNIGSLKLVKTRVLSWTLTHTHKRQKKEHRFEKDKFFRNSNKK
jgi:hypothetical protein